MAHYENQSDMFMKRAESCKKNGDRFYAQAKQTSNKDQYNQLMAQAQAHYQSQKRMKPKPNNMQVKLGNNPKVYNK
jgi:hypothetical protein